MYQPEPSVSAGSLHSGLPVLIDGLCDFIADIRNGRPDFSQVRRKLTVINLRPQLLGQMCFPDFSFEKIQIA
ncbi:hypothetical protein [Escherichia coli]|uniref:hypothetical protein n=1 Tax=Escherichia coli TaxID=562 RepID=UPI004043EA5F